ncbi:hypothetical protein AB9P05_06095 [Roseivirga sp. BDSF3-8]|uniref:hypothetical protein n=1 Tax=Roseivirga sp. BDSF3-8 TaxID=3241598 RepID=UPI0035322616
MKKTFLITACALMTTGFVSAQSLATTEAAYNNTEIEVVDPLKEAEVKRTPVGVEELPEQVVVAYSESQYADWDISKAYKVETKENETMVVTYELHLGEGEIEMTEGETIEEPAMGEPSTETVLVIDEAGTSVQEKIDDSIE